MSAARVAAPFLALCTGAALLFSAFFMVGPLAPLFGASLGAPPAAIGVVVSAAYLFPFFLAIPAGSLVDRLGPKPLLLVGTAVLAAAPAWLVIAPSLASLLTLQVLSGLGQVIAVVAAQSVVASFGAGANRERNFGWYAAFVSAGQLLGPVLGGTLVDVSGFRAAFAVAGGLAALAGAAFALTRPALPPRRPVRARTSNGIARDLLALMRLPTVRLSLLVSVAVMVALTNHNSFLPAYLDGFRVPATVIGAIISARSLASIAVRPFMATLVARMGGRFRTFLVTLAAAAIGVAGIAAGPSLPVLLAASVVLGLGIGVAQPLTMVSVIEQVEAGGHGLAFGLRVTANRMVQVVTPLVLGVVAQFAGYAAMFVLAAAVVAVIAALLGVRARAFTAVGEEPA